MNGHVGTEDEGAAPRRPHEAEDHAHRRALPRAVGAEEAEDLGIEYLQTNIGDGGDPAVPLPETFRAQDLAPFRHPP